MMVGADASAGKGGKSQCRPVGGVLGSADVNGCSLHGKDATCVRYVSQPGSGPEPATAELSSQLRYCFA